MTQSNDKPVIVWFKQDLRLKDQPALAAAIQLKAPIIPLFIWSPKEEGNWPMGAASQWWLHHSLQSLEKDLSDIGLKLIIKQGSYLDTLKKLAKETEAQALFWNRNYEPAAIEVATKIKSELKKEEIDARSFNGSLLFNPWAVLNKQNEPYQVFTPFWKTCLKHPEPNNIFEAPKKATAYKGKIDSDTVDKLGLLPKIHWDKGLEEAWQPGEKHAAKALQEAIDSVIAHYSEKRDFPAEKTTSMLSPYLHHGELSPHTIWHAVKAEKKLKEKEAEAFLRQLCWREFGYYLLYHFPSTPEKPLQSKFEDFPWKKSKKDLQAWQKGMTGYPFVDAGMRQLWQMGWMHNRLRLVVGSFLIKDLLISWQEGEKWFWDTLVDADLANNTLGWQWVGGCGADAAPYFRIFNPVTQSEKFDPEGDYIKKWVPELAKLPKKWIHRPWEAPQEVLQEAGVELGKDYPLPIVDHNEARQKALDAFEEIKK